jgi:preprotein translocase SecE subunit
MRKVSFPDREEVRTYSIIVFIFLVVVTSIVGLLDFGVSHLVLKVFN